MHWGLSYTYTCIKLQSNHPLAFCTNQSSCHSLNELKTSHDPAQHRESLSANCDPPGAAAEAVPAYWGLIPPLCLVCGHLSGQPASKDRTAVCGPQYSSRKISCRLLHQSELMPLKCFSRDEHSREPSMAHSYISFDTISYFIIVFEIV